MRKARLATLGGPVCRAPTGRNTHDRVLLHTPPVMKKARNRAIRAAGIARFARLRRAVPV